jgi:hypothetical protein
MGRVVKLIVTPTSCGGRVKWNCTSIPPIYLNGIIIKYRDNFTFCRADGDSVFLRIVCTHLPMCKVDLTRSTTVRLRTSCLVLYLPFVILVLIIALISSVSHTFRLFCDVGSYDFFALIVAQSLCRKRSTCRNCSI